MDQAIHIATSQYPGKVLQCSLGAEKWKEPGILDSDGRVFYRVVLISSEDAQSGGATHVWVNAIDGTVIKVKRNYRENVSLNKFLPNKPGAEPLSFSPGFSPVSRRANHCTTVLTVSLGVRISSEAKPLKRFANSQAQRDERDSLAYSRCAPVL